MHHAGPFIANRKFEVDTIAVAKMIGVSPHVIRNWAARGHIQPVRTDGKQTIYDAEAVVKVAASFGYLPDLREQDDGHCWAPGCKSVSWPDAPMPLCMQHAVTIWLFVNDEWYRRLHAPEPDGWRDGEWNPAHDRAGSQQPIVYFIQMGDRIKIGTTINLPKRLADYRTHSGHEPQVLLAVPGDSAEEKRVHELFAGERIRGEWFWPSPRLTEFMAERFDQDIRNAHGPLLAQAPHP